PLCSDPSNYRNRDSPANGARWAGWRAAATAYRAPTRCRPLFRRTVGVRPVGARAAAIASAEVRIAPLRPGSAWPGGFSEAAMPHYRSAQHRRFPEPFVREIEERFGDCLDTDHNAGRGNGMSGIVAGKQPNEAERVHRGERAPRRGLDCRLKVRAEPHR